MPANPVTAADREFAEVCIAAAAAETDPVMAAYLAHAADYHTLRLLTIQAPG